MNILIFYANWNNRGDEAAIRAMIDELRIIYPQAKFKLQFNQEVSDFPYKDMEIIYGFYRPKRNKIKLAAYNLYLSSSGKINFLFGGDKKKIEKFNAAVKWADIAIYAPGGPCIGENFKQYTALDMMYLMRKQKVPYMFFAPSMGPFGPYKRRIKKVLKNAEFCAFREEISAGFVKTLDSNINTYVTLDSAFQHPVDMEKYGKQFSEYTELKNFVEHYDKVIGITITDLLWHRNYKDDRNIVNKIRVTFESFVNYLSSSGYGIVFIPQLFSAGNDREYMNSFAIENCYTVDDVHDCYFQQYLISQLYAVVGMRYHSNIFSAKEGTPFISISYEHKMKGFMAKAGLEKYCIDIMDLNYDRLKNTFEALAKDYTIYKVYLDRMKDKWKSESYKTTELVRTAVKKCNVE